MTNLGLYIHTPFCKQKCNYCDFYSFAANKGDLDSYTVRVTDYLKKWGVHLARPIDSLYLGGGTPTLLGGENIRKIIRAAEDAFPFANPEITLECNPADDLKETLTTAKKAGVNRLSVGVQSGNADELLMLGRRHTTEDAKKTVALARECGIDNISLDLMIGLPHGNIDKLSRSIDFVCSLYPTHISVYILKIEEGTPFYKNGVIVPCDEEIEKQYLFTAQKLESRGFLQYEISNFAKAGFESRHNKKYWNCEEYLGIGPAAHSFINGKRFYYPRDFRGFMDGCEIIPDGTGGDADEYIMLRLRLSDGIIFEEYEKRYGTFPSDKIKKAETLAKHGLIKIDNKSLSLTKKGFLLSNSVIGEFI